MRRQTCRHGAARIVGATCARQGMRALTAPCRGQLSRCGQGGLARRGEGRPAASDWGVRALQAAVAAQRVAGWGGKSISGRRLWSLVAAVATAAAPAQAAAAAAAGAAGCWVVGWCRNRWRGLADWAGMSRVRPAGLLVWRLPSIGGGRHNPNSRPLRTNAAGSCRRLSGLLRAAIGAVAPSQLAAPTAQGRDRAAASGGNSGNGRRCSSESSQLPPGNLRKVSPTRAEHGLAELGLPTLPSCPCAPTLPHPGPPGGAAGGRQEPRQPREGQGGLPARHGTAVCLKASGWIGLHGKDKLCRCVEAELRGIIMHGVQRCGSARAVQARPCPYADQAAFHPYGFFRLQEIRELLAGVGELKQDTMAKALQVGACDARGVCVLEEQCGTQA